MDKNCSIWRPSALARLGFAFLLMVGSTGPAWPQAGETGIITGRVSNAATGSNLEGAVVRLEGTEHSTRSARDGTYRLRVPAGTYQLNASYVGLEAASAPVTVAAGATVRQPLMLTSQIYQLQEFTVAGEREGNALAITLQRQAPNVKNVVSSDAFGSLQGNPGDLLQRLPGVIGVETGGEIRYVQIRGMSQELSTVTVDGNRMANAGSAGTNRHFQFQTLVSEGIGRMEVIKSPTPDMDADSIGGAVNMISTSAFDRSPERRISGSYGFTTRPTDDRDELRPHYSLSYSEVFADKLGVSINYGKRQQLSSQDRTRIRWERTAETDQRYIWNFQLYDFRNIRTRWGGNIKLDYKLSDATRFFFNTSMNKHYEHANHGRIEFSTGRRVAQLDENGNILGRGAILPDYTNQVTEWRGDSSRPSDNRATVVGNTLNKDAATWHYQIGSVHQFEGVEIDYDAYFSDSDTEYVDQGTFQLRAEGVGMRIETDPSQPSWPSFTQINGPDIFDINSYSDFNRFDIVDRMAVDKYQGAQFNLKKEFDTAVPTYIKTGLRVRQQTRDRHDSPQRWTFIGSDLAQFENTQLDYDFHGRYPAYADMPIPTRPFRDEPNSTDDYWGYNVATALRESPELFKEDIVYNTAQRETNKLNFEETISAAYLMGNADLGRMSILGGLRVENTETWGKGAVRVITPEERARRNAWEGPVTDEEARRRIEAEFAEPFEDTGEYKKVFPGLHLKYEMMPGLILRGSWATNIGRPNISTLVPRTNVDFEDQLVIQNNPGLQPQYADNFDLMVEYYFEPVGLLSAGVFLKEISDFIFTDESQVVGIGADNGFGGAYEGFSLRTQSNGGSARVRGFELAYQQQLTFLPGWLEGLGVFANYTRLQTKGDYGGSSVRETGEVAGFVPETGNFGISYIRGGHSIRLQFNHIGRHLDSYSSNPALLRYRRAKSAVDIKSVFRINRNLEIYADVWNVFGEVNLHRERPAGYSWQTSKMYPQIHFGMRARY